jgi:hypothetical protein
MIAALALLSVAHAGSCVPPELVQGAAVVVEGQVEAVVPGARSVEATVRITGAHRGRAAGERVQLDGLQSADDPAGACGIARLRPGAEVLVVEDETGRLVLLPADALGRSQWGPPGDGPALPAAPPTPSVILLPLDDAPPVGQVQLAPDHIRHAELLAPGPPLRARVQWNTATMVLELPEERVVPVVRETTTLAELVLPAGTSAPGGQPRLGSLVLHDVPEGLLDLWWVPVERAEPDGPDGEPAVLRGPGPAWLRADSAVPELQQDADQQTVLVVGEAEGGRVPVHVWGRWGARGIVWVSQERLSPPPPPVDAQGRPRSIVGVLGSSPGSSIFWRDGQRACVPRERPLRPLSGGQPVVRAGSDCTTVAVLGHHEKTWLVALPTPLGDVLLRVDCPRRRQGCLKPYGSRL